MIDKINKHLEQIKDLDGTEKRKYIDKIQQMGEEIDSSLKEKINLVLETDKHEISLEPEEVMEEDYIKKLPDSEIEIHIDKNISVTKKSNRLETTNYFNNQRFEVKNSDTVFYNVKEINNNLFKIEELNIEINKIFKTISIISNYEEDFDDSEDIKKVKQVLVEVMETQFINEYNEFTQELVSETSRTLEVSPNDLLSIDNEEIEKILQERFKSNHLAASIHKYRKKIRYIVNLIKHQENFQEQLKYFTDNKIEEEINDITIQQQRVDFDSISSVLNSNQKSIYSDIKKRFYKPFFQNVLLIEEGE